MATNYPGGLDSFNNPTANTPENATGYEHDLQHSNANDAIEAIQAELGINPAGTYSTVAARLDDIGATVQTYTPSLTASTTSPTLGTGGFINGRYWIIKERCIVDISVRWGTSPSVGNGTYYISLPSGYPAYKNLSDANDPMGIAVGYGYMRDDSAMAYRQINCWRHDGYGDGTAISMHAANAWVTNSVPWAPAANDTWTLHLDYEIGQ